MPVTYRNVIVVIAATAVITTYIRFNNVGARRTYAAAAAVMTLRIKQQWYSWSRVFTIITITTSLDDTHATHQPTNKQTNNKSSTMHPFSLCASASARACNNFGIGILNNNITRDLNNNSSSSCGGGAIPSPPTGPSAVSIRGYTTTTKIVDEYPLEDSTLYFPSHDHVASDSPLATHR